MRLAEAIGDAIRTWHGRNVEPPSPGVLPAHHLTVRRVEEGSPKQRQHRAMLVVGEQLADLLERLVPGTRRERWAVEDFTDDEGVLVAYALMNASETGDRLRGQLEAYAQGTVFLDREVFFCSYPGLFTPPVARRVDIPPLILFRPRRPAPVEETQP